MSACVVVIRTKSGDDLLAILVGELEGIIRTEHPFYVKYNVTQGNFTMVPYCSLSNETYFEFRQDSIEFIVTANFEITSKFLRMVDAYVQTCQEDVESLWEQDQEVNQLESALNKTMFIQGNDTMH